MSLPQSEQQSSSTRTNRIILSVSTLPLGITCLALLVWSIRVIPQHQKLMKLYQNSPGCATIAPRSSVSLLPCRFVSEHIINKRYEQYSKDPDQYYITLQHNGDVPHEVRILGYGLWKQAKVGDIVTTKNWQGKVMTVNGFGYKTVTPENPNYISRDDGSAIPEMAIGTGIFFLIFVVGWNLTSAKKHGSKPSIP